MLDRLIAFIVALALVVAGTVGPAGAASRIKDIVSVEGFRNNQMLGYGLVVGLQGTGDTMNNSPFTKQSIQAMLERLGVNVRDLNLNTKNIAAVMVTTDLPPFAASGTRIDVNVSALGDAKSLQGGTLLVTPLLGADGEVYVTAQGPVAIGGFLAQGSAASVSKGVPTAGRIANGGEVEREIPFKPADLGTLRLSLKNPDLTTARRVSLAINELLGQNASEMVDPATVRVQVPRKYNGNIVDLLTDIEQLLVEPDQSAKVVINEATGIIVMGQEVRVSAVAVAQGNLTVSVSETPQVSQPNPLSNGTTRVTNRTAVNVSEGNGKKIALVQSGVTLQDLVDGLNSLGIGPRDLISILQAIKSAGALQADIQVM